MIKRVLPIIWILAIFIHLPVQAENISFAEALNKNWVEMTISGAETDNYISHFGKCITVNIINKSNKILTLEVFPGQMLSSQDTLVQNMMVTEHRILTLNPRAEKQAVLFAMCAEKEDTSPDPDVFFDLGLMAEPGLKGLADMVYKKKFQNGMGQNAVWVITDDSPLTSIHDGNVQDVNMLRYYVSQAKGIPFIKYYGDAENVSGMSTVTGNFKTHIIKKGLATMILIDPDGYTVATFFEGKEIEPGSHTFRFDYNYIHLEKGKYKLILYLNNEAIKEKEFVFRR